MSFDKQMAIQGAELIQKLYLGQLKPTINQASTDTQVLILALGNQVWVIFPGTDGLQDWRTDARIIKVQFGDQGKIHSGFYLAERSVIQQIIARLIELRAEEVVVVGHSLGGALALPTALEVAKLSCVSRVQVYTYGQPRVGNGAFARAYDAALNDVTFRIANDRDPVPNLPPWMLGYRHAGREVFLNRNGQIEVQRGLISQLLTNARNGAADYQTNGQAALADISAHHIGSYIQKLKEGEMA